MIPFSRTACTALLALLCVGVAAWYAAVDPMNHRTARYLPPRIASVDQFDAIVERVPGLRDVRWPLSRRTRVRSLHRLAAAAHAMLDGAKIEHWLDAGTLLGTFRGGDIIPHDVDVDIGVMQAGRIALRGDDLQVPPGFAFEAEMSKAHPDGGRRDASIVARLFDTSTGCRVDIIAYLDPIPCAEDEDESHSTCFNPRSQLDAQSGGGGGVAAEPSAAVPSVGDPGGAASALPRAEDYVTSVWSKAFEGCAHCAWSAKGDGRRRPLYLRRDLFPLSPCWLGATEHMCPAHAERVLHYLYGASLAPPSRLHLLRAPLLRAGELI